ncbi:hypothetical protein [Paenibacillus mendelii]|uniref:Uncharacterized protein n=1 Tax=Paenibacillus mendelii TaxID=206163 RepID=A0ABV6JEG6_9BACL|nr:hypothetical protein [Paenibacillus mendelii]
MLFYHRLTKLPYADTLVKGLFLELWVYLLRENEWSHHPEIVNNLDELNAGKSYLDCHYDREVSLDTLSALSNISILFDQPVQKDIRHDTD